MCTSCNGTGYQEVIDKGIIVSKVICPDCGGRGI